MAVRLLASGAVSGVLLACALVVTAGAEERGWPDSLIGRLAATAELEMLNADLLSHDSATLTLERWCGAHRLAAAPRVVAALDRGESVALPAADRALLGLSENEPLRYRHVRLTCGSHVLSEADNWYVPSRLEPEMNRLLKTTDTPFGRAVAALGFARHTLAAEVLWHPLPDDWDLAGPGRPETRGATLTVPDTILRHRAVLIRRDGLPFSLVVETYRRDMLANPPPLP